MRHNKPRDHTRDNDPDLRILGSCHFCGVYPYPSTSSSICVARGAVLRKTDKPRLHRAFFAISFDESCSSSKIFR